MTDVFISYSREDRTRIEKLAAALEAEGVSVWWDQNLAGGAEFSKETESKLNDAGLVLVAWSKASVDSMWVADEATVGRDRGVLLPIAIDDVQPKIGFRQIQTLDFHQWRGDREAGEFQQLLSAISTRTDARNGAGQTKTNWLGRRLSAANALLVGSGLAVAASLALLVYWNGQSRKPEAGAPEIATTESSNPSPAADKASAPVRLGVIPFINMSSDPEQEFFADGLTEELLNWLANVEGLEVPGRTASFQFKGQTGDFAAIGERLDVKYLLEGSVRRTGDRLRITAQLIDAETGFHLWSDIFDREIEDIFDIQEEVARRVVTELLGAITESGAKYPAAISGVDPHAHELYLEGRALWSRRYVRPAFAKFLEATKVDPNHALAQAFVAIGASNALLNGFDPGAPDGDVRGAMERAIAKAVALAPDNADVLYAQGRILHADAGSNTDRISAKTRIRISEFYERAIRANPRHAEALHALADLSTDDDRKVELLEQLLAIEPGIPAARGNLADILLRHGDLAAAYSIYEETYTLFPDTPRFYGANFYWTLGQQENQYRFLFDNWNGPGIRLMTHVFRAAALADLGAKTEAAMLLRDYADKTEDRVFARATRAFAAGLESDTALRLAEAKRAFETPNSADWTAADYAIALLADDQPELAMDVMLSRRENFAQDPAAVTPFGPVNTAIVAAIAMKRTGDSTGSEELWRAIENALDNSFTSGWRRDVNRAIVRTNVGDRDGAIAALNAAYEGGFRYPYTFECLACINFSFFDTSGYFAPLISDPEFVELRNKIVEANKRLFTRLDGEYDIVQNVRNEVSEAAAPASE